MAFPRLLTFVGGASSAIASDIAGSGTCASTPKDSATCASTPKDSATCASTPTDSILLQKSHTHVAKKWFFAKKTSADDETDEGECKPNVCFKIENGRANKDPACCAPPKKGMCGTGHQMSAGGKCAGGVKTCCTKTDASLSEINESSVSEMDEGECRPNVCFKIQNGRANKDAACCAPLKKGMCAAGHQMSAGGKCAGGVKTCCTKTEALLSEIDEISSSSSEIEEGECRPNVCLKIENGRANKDPACCAPPKKGMCRAGHQMSAGGKCAGGVKTCCTKTEASLSEIHSHMNSSVADDALGKCVDWACEIKGDPGSEGRAMGYHSIPDNNCCAPPGKGMCDEAGALKGKMKFSTAGKCTNCRKCTNGDCVPAPCPEGGVRTCCTEV